MLRLLPACSLLVLAAACAADSDPGAGGDRRDEGGDDTEWVEVGACMGFDLCLPDIVAAQDVTDPESDGIVYPMHAVIGEPFELDNVEISDNCAGSLSVDAGNNLVCQPGGDATAAFQVGRFARESTTEQGMRVIFFDYATAGRATLLRDAASEGRGRFKLEIE